MRNNLYVHAILKFLLGVLLVGALLFLPAGTMQYPGGWLLMGVLFIPMLAAGIVMMFRNPALLEKRLRSGEEEKEQRAVIRWSALMFVCGFALAGLDFRFRWTNLPFWVSVLFSVMFLSGYLLYAAVLRENIYLSRTVEIQQSQKVIDTGVYGVVRHPMYSATLLLFLSMPWILGSSVSFAVFLAYPFLIEKRIQNEERILEQGLEGYGEYKKKTPYKMIPFLW